MRIAIAAVTALLFAASAQAQLGDILRRVDPNKIKKGAKVVRDATREFTDEEEKDIGRIVAARVLATYPLSKKEKLQKYVTLVGNTVAAYSARPTLGWHFAVLETPVVNAFSCPGGFIFITTGALEQMSSEAELAAVLGHEIAHTTQRHIVKEIRRSSVVMGGIDLAGDSTSFGNSLTDEVGEKLGQLAYEKLFTSGLSRRDEHESDKIGVELASAAGYKSAEFLRFLDGLGELEGSSQMKVLVATHPSAADRAKNVKPIVAKEEQGAVLADRWKNWTQLSAR
jgi:predicted Zn-dependent protease